MTTAATVKIVRVSSSQSATNFLSIMDVEHFSSPTSQFPKKKCGVLGATGSVGQRFILLLALHPHFTLHAVLSLIHI